MARLDKDAYAELDNHLSAVDDALRRHYPGDPAGRQPVHTVYVPADRFDAELVQHWGEQALASIVENPPFPFPTGITARVTAKLAREPIEDLRIDFEDGYGTRDDDEEDAAAEATARALAALIE